MEGALKGSAGAVFSSPSRRQRQENVTEADLMEKVGRLTVEGDWLKKILAAGDKPGRIELLKGETGEKRLPFGRKCELLGISPSTAYSRREPVANPRDEEDMELARKIEGIYEKCPFYGSRRIVHEISRDERPVNRKHVRRLMRKTGISGLSPGPATSWPHPAA